MFKQQFWKEHLCALQVFVCVCLYHDLCARTHAHSLAGEHWKYQSFIRQPMAYSSIDPLAHLQGDPFCLFSKEVFTDVMFHSFIHSFITSIYIAPLQVGLLR